MTKEEALARLAELEPLLEEADDITEALRLEYFVYEGFIELMEIDGEVYLFPLDPPHMEDIELSL